MNALIPFILSRCVSDVCAMISQKYGFDGWTALRSFLFSETYRMLSTPRLRMWDFTSDVIFDLWECEQITGNPRNSIHIREMQ